MLLLLFGLLDDFDRLVKEAGFSRSRVSEANDLSHMLEAFTQNCFLSACLGYVIVLHTAAILLPSGSRT